MFRLLLLFVLSISCTKKEGSQFKNIDVSTLNYVGSNSCKECHNDQFRKWEKSHHFRSMNEATDEFVIGDFNNKSIMRKGQKHEMYKKDGKYYVKTDGEDGKIKEFEIKYTFGFKPIQQYLVELDRGRLQGIISNLRYREKILVLYGR